VDTPSYVAAPYVQGEITLYKGLTFSPGLRIDYNPRIGWMTSPRGSLNYRVLENTTLKVIYGEAFRSPNAYELYYFTPTGANLKPERLTSWEGDWDQRLTHNLSASLSVYSNRMRDFIDLAPADESQTFENDKQKASEGTELELRGQWSNGISGYSTYSYQFAQEDRENGHLLGSPKHLSQVNLSVPLFDRKFFATVDAQYVGRRLALDHDVVSPYTVVNFTLLTRKVTRNLDLSASVYNAFDKRYYDPGAQQHVQDALQQDGRNLRAKLTWTFGAR
jgi:iron complex outermembrane receptor protein